MGTLQRYALGSSLCLAPLLLAACGVVTADDGGLFASVAASGPQAGSGGAGGGGPAGGAGGGTATCGNGKVEPGEDCDESNASCVACKRTSQTLVGGDNCGDLPVPIRLGLGAGTNFYKGKGDTSAAGLDFTENLCEDQNAGASSLGPDRLHVVEITSPEGGYLTVRLVRTDNATTFDAVVYARDSCAGPGLFCADAFSFNVGGSREPASGGEILSFPVLPDAPKTYFIYVDGVTALDKGSYDIEFSFNKGTCDDPIPVFVERGSPVRVLASNKLKDNIQLSCGNSGTADVIYKVSRAEGGVMTVSLDTAEAAVGFAVLEQTCDPQRLVQSERPQSCKTGSTALFAEADWPNSSRSLFVAVDVGDPGGPDRTVGLVLDPNVNF